MTEKQIKEKTLDEFFENYMSAVVDGGLPANAGGYAFVRGFGLADSRVVMVGEAPGKDEVAQGRPFVGQAGKILTHFLEAAGIKREELYITNLIKYRLAREGKRAGTLANRPATSVEINFSSPYLKKELEIISPQVVVTLGNVPLKGMDLAFDCGGLAIKEVHGKLIKLKDHDNLYMFPMYHPASTIYRPELSNVYEHDLKLLNEALKSI